MNQILSMNNDNNNNNYNKDETKKIITIFCIALIVIALLIVGVLLLSRKKDEGNYAPPTLEVVRKADREVSIIASCEDGIKYVLYTWNDENENRVNLDGSSSFERIINIPEKSNNTLNIEVVSMKGVSAKKAEEFEVEIDTNKPKIDAMNVVGSTLHIEASDDTGISRLVYQWEDEEENIIEANQTDNTNIVANISIKRGTYKLKVKVFDISGNKEEVSKLITGVNQPEIMVVKYGDIVKATVTHDMGFKRIEYLINDSLYVYDENYSQYDKEKTTVEFDFPLKQGENIVKIKAYSFEKMTEDEEDVLDNYSNNTFSGTCTYEAE